MRSWIDGIAIAILLSTLSHHFIGRGKHLNIHLLKGGGEMKKTRKLIVLKTGSYKTKIVAMLCCGNGPFSRH